MNKQTELVVKVLREANEILERELRRDECERAAARQAELRELFEPL